MLVRRDKKTKTMLYEYFVNQVPSSPMADGGMQDSVAVEGPYRSSHKINQNL